MTRERPALEGDPSSRGKHQEEKAIKCYATNKRVSGLHMRMSQGTMNGLSCHCTSTSDVVISHGSSRVVRSANILQVLADYELARRAFSNSHKVVGFLPSF